jgi:HD-GYP domain-containing protein (c-di-GMP phosphodiesterase class II)
MRILAVADVFDALTAERPYRGAMPVEEALAVISREAGSGLCPRSVAALETAVARGTAAPAALASTA